MVRGVEPQRRSVKHWIMGGCLTLPVVCCCLLSRWQDSRFADRPHPGTVSPDATESWGGSEHLQTLLRACRSKDPAARAQARADLDLLSSGEVLDLMGQLSYAQRSGLVVGPLPDLVPLLGAPARTALIRQLGLDQGSVDGARALLRASDLTEEDAPELQRLLDRKGATHVLVLVAGASPDVQRALAARLTEAELASLRLNQAGGDQQRGAQALLAARR